MRWLSRILCLFGHTRENLYFDGYEDWQDMRCRFCGTILYRRRWVASGLAYIAPGYLKYKAVHPAYIDYVDRLNDAERASIGSRYLSSRIESGAMK